MTENLGSPWRLLDRRLRGLTSLVWTAAGVRSEWGTGALPPEDLLLLIEVRMLARIADRGIAMLLHRPWAAATVDPVAGGVVADVIVNPTVCACDLRRPRAKPGLNLGEPAALGADVVA